MVSERSGERVQPVLLTAWPWSSSQGCSNSICVERPTPSVPSITMRCPGSEPTLRYGSPCPYQVFDFLPLRGTLAPARALIAPQHLVHHAADGLLLARYVARRVDDSEAELHRELIVYVEHATLEEAEALGGIGGQPDVHAGLVVLELRPPGEQPLQRDVDRHPEVERQVRPRGEAVDSAHPARIHSTG